VILTGVCYLALAFFILTTWACVMSMCSSVYRVAKALEKSEALLKDIRDSIRAVRRTIGHGRN